MSTSAAVSPDVKALQTLTSLLDNATDKRETHPSPAVLKGIRTICKESDANIPGWISGVLLHRLADDHAQTRLHVVNLADQLFQRSKVFRTHLTANFTQFLELSLGFRPDKPLPGPAAVANQLRQRSLEVVEQWNDKFGSSYKQVSLGYTYLKNSMAMRFPEVRARAAAAEAEAEDRQARSKALVQEKYHQICQGFDGHLEDMQATVLQIAEGLAILRGSSAQPHMPASKATTTPEDEIAWEVVDDVPAPGASTSTADAGEEASEEGLAAYAMDTIPADLLHQATVSTSTAVSDDKQFELMHVTANPAVVEMLQGLDKLVNSRHLPRLQDWLKTFVKADVGSPGSEQHAKREQMLRASLAMQTQLKVCRQELQTLNQQLAAQSSASVPLADLGVNARSGLSQTSAVAAGQAVNMVDLFGSDDEVEDTDDPPAVAQPAQGKPGKSARSAVPSTIADNVTALHMPTTHATQHLPSARLGNPSSLMSVPAGSQARGGMLHQQKQQAQAFDPAKAKRSISFNNSIRRSRQVAKQRSQVFNDAADAAVAEAAATARLKSADANATELASQLADAPERNKAPDCIPRPSTQPRAVAPQLAMPTASAAAATVSAAAPAAAAPVPTAAAPAPIPSAPARSASATVLAVLKEPETTVTRPIHAEVAPKLKMGSRLAANMAKLAASRKATSAAAVPPASTAAPADVADKQQAPVKKEGKKSAIPEDIKRKLLAKAPVVAHGNDLDYWDANNARALVNARGMEYQNHWGAHDPDVELPSDQLNAFFGTRAEYWTPSSKPTAAASGHPQVPPGHAKPAAGHSHVPSGHCVAAVDPSGGQQHAALGDAATGTSTSTASQAKAQRAADRAHNEAVLASTDAQVVQAIAEEERQAVTKAANEKKRKPQPSVRERLAKKLLSGRARGATLGEMESAADARFHEVNSNQWKATRFP